MSQFEQAWKVPDARANVVLVHGTGEHSGRYRVVAEHLNRHGYGVYAGDLPGWGRSAGYRGHVDSFDEYVRAVGQWVSAVAEAHPFTPLFLLGHSLGGLIAVRVAQTAPERQKLAGLVLSSPCLKLKLNVPTWKAGLARRLDRLLPRLRLPHGIDAQDVSRDPAVRVEYRTDPLNYGRVSVRWFNELLRAMALASREVERLTLPLLVLQAGADRLVDAEAAERFVADAPTADKTYQVFPGLYHEVFNEPEREAVLRRLTDWLDERTTPPAQM